MEQVNNNESNEAVVRAENIVKSFKIDGRTLTVLDGVNLSVRQGEIVGIVGSSGAGKTTLLHMLGSLDKPSSGSIHYGEIDVFNESEAKRAKLRSEKIGFVFQSHMLLPEFSAIENVALAAMITGAKKRNALELAKPLLEAVGLSERMEHRPGKLSGGEQQRVAIARALINGPELVLCDEPTGNLDSRTGGEIFELIRSLNREKEQAFIIVTHNMALAEKMDRVITLEDGKVIN